MNKLGYPDGTPDKDRERLRLWWEEEMKSCGLSGSVKVDYVPVHGDPPPRSAGQRFLDFMSMGMAIAGGVHMYVAEIPGAAWPVETAVTTTDTGMIMSVVYRATVTRQAAGEVTFKKSLGLLSLKLEILGQMADYYKTKKELIKRCREGLKLRHEPPLRGFHAGKKFIELREASVVLRPESRGSEVLITTAAREQSAFVGKTYSLGLACALDILKAVESGA